MKFAISFAVLVACASVAAAAVNDHVGPSNGVRSDHMDRPFAANFSVFAEPQAPQEEITQINFFVAEYDKQVEGVFEGLNDFLTVQIRASDNHAPDDTNKLLDVTVPASSINLVDLGIDDNGGYEVFRIDVPLPTSVTLGAGNYWLTGFEGSTFGVADSEPVFWTYDHARVEQFPIADQKWDGTNSTWVDALDFESNNQEFYFEIISTSVPEPTGIALGGLAALLGLLLPRHSFPG